MRCNMNRTCSRCGKTIEGEGMAFCPYCGEKLQAESVPENRNEEAKKWVNKALSVPSYPERKKILLKGLEACQDSPEIRWEMLFIGEEGPKKGKVINYSIIKSWVLEIYWKPKDFSTEQKDRMRAELFDAPQLKETLALFEDPERKQEEYIQRLCREYVELFLEGNNQVMGNIFGFQIGKNKDRKLAAPVAQMIRNIRADEKLNPEQQEMLRRALYLAYSARTAGGTEHLDAALNDE